MNQFFLVASKCSLLSFSNTGILWQWDDGVRDLVVRCCPCCWSEAMRCCRHPSRLELALMWCCSIHRWVHHRLPRFLPEPRMREKPQRLLYVAVGDGVIELVVSLLIQTAPLGCWQYVPIQSKRGTSRCASVCPSLNRVERLQTLLENPECHPCFHALLKSYNKPSK